ncbi:conserved membrane hypothetical protein [Pseudomonas sp. 9AZ]|uniref:hypothetical protein n=1 Tax=Pseudomonas sp. 9AZ TaxID=2653168 RepID=UPI0012F05C49|nr:hypothetical protein [Pseudomonas sp. 9AZ]VXC36924.1 conserved membrane hypothetical protein [Pseudomonas sp. 9AZ]
MTEKDEKASPLINNGLEGRECVPFFTNDRSQIAFEFLYLILTLLIASGVMISLQFYGNDLGISHRDKLAMMAIIGGFLGGWVYDTKWFYRVTARGKHDQHGFPWQPHKFYWRIMTPFLSSLVAFSTYLLATADFFPFSVKEKESARTAFAMCFLLGYFSDLVLSRLAAWAEKVIPKASND